MPDHISTPTDSHFTMAENVPYDTRGHVQNFATNKSVLFPTFDSTLLNLLISILSLPLQALAILILSRSIQIFVLSIDELYEITGRRARSKFATFPWMRVIAGVLLMTVYHVGLMRLVIRSWKGLRRGG